MLPVRGTLFEDPKPGRKMGFGVPAPYTVVKLSADWQSTVICMT